METLTIDTHGPIYMVTLNRPQVRNAFNREMISEVTKVFVALADMPEIRVVILQGAGAAFSAGADITWMRESLAYTEEENLADALRMSDMFASIQSCPKAVIARVQGAALGGGMGLIAACDMAIAVQGATFGFTEAKLGIIPAVISQTVLPKIGPSWARVLFLTAQRFGPELAREIGLVHWVVPEDELDSRIGQLIRELLTSGPQAVREGKKLIFEADGLDSASMRQMTAMRIASLRTSAEGQEGLQAFLEKRMPSWSADAS